MSESSSSGLFQFLTRVPEDRTALVHEGRTLSYGALVELATRAAVGLFQLGLRRGDRIAVMVPNGVDWIVVNFGAALLGAAIVPLNIRLGPKEVGDLISRTSAKAIVYDPRALEGLCAATLRATDPAAMGGLIGIVQIGEAAERFEVPGIVTVELLQLLQREVGSAGAAAASTGGGADPCLIMATSGTTGRPKIIVHLQERVARHMTDAACAAGLAEPGAKTLIVMPLGGAFGYTLVMSALAGGRTAVIAEGFDAVGTAELARAEAITHMGGTNDMLFNMLKADPRPDPFPSLRTYVHANFTPSLIEMPPEAERRNVLIRGAYGLSELLAFVALQPPGADLDQRAQAGGVLVDSGANFRISDPETGKPMADGEVGEIEIHTPNAMWGYLDDAEATAAIFTADGFMKTGDLGRKLPDGHLIFDSRRNDVLRIGGYLVSPAEIEDVILANDRIKACQVVAVAQPVGVRPVAFVVADAGAADEQALIATCRTKLAKYKIPIRVFFVESFPCVDGPNGKKVKRNELRDMAERMLLEDNL